MKYMLFLLLLFLAWPVYAQEQEKPPVRSFMGATQSEKKNAADSKPRQANVEIWLPPEFRSTEQKWPLLVFSHGFGGCARQSAFLTQYLADKGYIVVAPDHADARCNRGLGGGGRLKPARSGTRDWPEKPFRTPEAWTDKTESDRRADVLFAVSSMLDDRQYKNYIDVNRMGLIGHSLGGYTVLGVAGAWPSWRDRRFKAVLALSPYVGPYLVGGGLGKVNVPVMYQGGTKDDDITPDLRRKNGAYSRTQAPKYYIELNGADHYAWTETERGYQSIVKKTALQFFDKHVKGVNVDILPEGQDRPGGPANKVKTFWKEEKEGLKN